MGGDHVATTGSSPLARGLPGPTHGSSTAARIIPARTGFTHFLCSGVTSVPDHPRSRGVYSGRRSPNSGPRGSSPLARGLPHYWINNSIEFRIIPARAGFTCRDPIVHESRPDHPRSRGVYPGSANNPGTLLGSSPLARGLRGRVSSSSDGVGIIPARAGFTAAATPSAPLSPDHPRSRGVYIRSVRPYRMHAGSSPLARGLLTSRRSRRCRRRIIPARAGFTTRHSSPSSPRADHPRSRGVYDTTQLAQLAQSGSSPLARGLLLPARLSRDIQGIIPARAGFTPRRRLRRP